MPHYPQRRARYRRGVGADSGDGDLEVRTVRRCSGPGVVVALVALLGFVQPAVAASVTADLLDAAARGETVSAFVLLRGATSAYSAPAARAVVSRQERVLSALPPNSIDVRNRLEAVPAFVANLTPEALQALRDNPEVLAVDGMMEGGAALADTVPQIGAVAVHGAGWRGAGSVVALLDTGVDNSHPDLNGALAAEECFCLTGCCPDGSARQSGAGAARSLDSHGPHVAGIIASRGAVSSVGVAPESQLVAIRVLDDLRRGVLSDWVAALDWIVAERPDVSAINMSLVSDAQYEGDCSEATATVTALAQLAAQLRSRGVLIAAAAGNTSTVGKLPAPACVDEVLATGAVDKTDQIATFSNVAPGLDLLAPGVAVRSDKPGGGTVTLTGTSMAAPHVVGTLALLTPLVLPEFRAFLGDILRVSGRPITDDRTCEGQPCSRFPRVDAGGALAWIQSVPDMLAGGSGRKVDCQLEWRVIGAVSRPWHARPRLRCHDGDPSCDADLKEGQCTFTVSACFNVPDPRLTQCDPSQALSAYRLVRPSPSHPRDATDMLNVFSILSATPSLPITRAAECTPYFPFVVPRGPKGGSRTLRMLTDSPRGIDGDHLRFTCLPPSGQSVP